jgi:hypothetical protein
MAWFQGAGGVRPSKPISWLSAVVGVGMMVCVVLFFIQPGLAIPAFIGLWIVTLVGIVAYHVKNAMSSGGVDHTQFHIRAEQGGSSGGADFDQRLRDLERLREDGLLTEEEYRRKRADILSEDW